MNQKKKILIFSLTFLLISSITIFTLLPEFLANFQIKDFKPQAKDVSNLNVDNPEINAQDITHKLSLNSLNPFQVKTIFAQTSPTGPLFIKTIGQANFEEGYSVKQTSDGGYVITGYTWSFGPGDLFVIKLDSSGNLSWAKTIGGTGDDRGSSIQQTSDGGYVITGKTSSFGAGSYDVFVIKLDSSGNLSWAKTIGGANDDYGSSIQQTSDGGYVITGGTSSFGAGKNVFGAGNGDVFVIKLDSSGNLSWAKTIGGTDYDSGRSIQQTSDGGYVITGETGRIDVSGPRYDVFVIKLDSSGNLSWAKTIGGTGWDESSSIQQTSDGGYVITGETSSFGAGGGDVFVIKLDSSGNLSWAKTIGGKLGDSGNSIQQTSDGGYVITGETWRFEAGSSDVFVIKLDSSGNLSWAKTIPGVTWDEGKSIQQTSDGGYVITGYTESFGAGWSDVFVIKLDSSGNIPGCPYISSVSPSVKLVSPSVASISPTLTSVTPSISSVSPSISDVSPTVDSVCGPSTPVSTSTPTPTPTPIGRTGYNVGGWTWSEREALIFILVVAILIIGGVFFVKIFKLKKIRK
jgi:hypothetical protein